MKEGSTWYFLKVYTILCSILQWFGFKCFGVLCIDRKMETSYIVYMYLATRYVWK